MEASELPAGVQVGPEGKVPFPQGLSGYDGHGQPGAEGRSSRLGMMARVFLDQVQCLPPLGPITASEVCGTEGQPQWAPGGQ